MRLRLEPNTDVLYRRRENRVNYSSEGARGPVLAVREGLRLGGYFVEGFVLFGCISSFECTAGIVKASELD